MIRGNLFFWNFVVYWVGPYVKDMNFHIRQSSMEQNLDSRDLAHRDSNIFFSCNHNNLFHILVQCVGNTQNHENVEMQEWCVLKVLFHATDNQMVLPLEADSA